jgi:hypothetical protein
VKVDRERSRVTVENSVAEDRSITHDKSLQFIVVNCTDRARYGFR